MKKIAALVFFGLIAIAQVNASGNEPQAPVGMSVIKRGSLVKLFYRGEQAGGLK